MPTNSSDDLKKPILKGAEGSNEAEHLNGTLSSGPRARLVMGPPLGGDPSEDEDDDRVDEQSESVDADLLADYPNHTEELELVHSRLASTSSLRLSRFAASLKKLCLRQNFLTILPPDDFQPLVHLEELDLYDNKVRDLGNSLDDMKNLAVLDLSFNLIRSIPTSLSSLSSLRTLYLVQNKISRIEALNALGPTLRSLELGGNKLRSIENLDALVNLEELWLGKNKITKLQNLQCLRKLRILSIQSNRITRLEGLEGLQDLEELYISHNGVQKIEGLNNNSNLRTLDVGNNEISVLENLSHLSQLQELWMNNNKIPDLQALETELATITTLETVYLEGNPCQSKDMSGYRRKIMLALPQVQQIDATYVRQQ